VLEGGLLLRAKLNMVMRYSHPQKQHKAEAMQRLEKANAAAEIVEFERVHTKTPTREDSATNENNRKLMKGMTPKPNVLLIFQCCEYLVVVLLDLNFRKDVRDLSLLVDNKRCPLDSHVLLSIHGFLFPRAVGFDDLLIRICEQWKIEIKLVFELVV